MVERLTGLDDQHLWFAIDRCGLGWPGQQMVVYGVLREGLASTVVKGRAMIDGPYGFANGATITLTSHSRSHSTRTVADESFSFHGIIPGAYSVAAAMRGRRQLEPFGPSEVNIPVPGASAEVDVYLSARP